MSKVITAEDLNWQCGSLTSWAMVGGDHLITKISENSYLLDCYVDDGYMMPVGYFSELDDVLAVINHDQKGEV